MKKILRIGELAGLGLSNDQIADCLDMSRSSFYKCMQKNADFRDSLERGRSKALMEISNALYESARAGNVKAQIYFLRCRDPQNWNVTKKVELDVDFKKMSDSQLLEELETDKDVCQSLGSGMSDGERNLVRDPQQYLILNYSSMTIEYVFNSQFLVTQTALSMGSFLVK